MLKTLITSVYAFWRSHRRQSCQMASSKPFKTGSCRDIDMWLCYDWPKLNRYRTRAEKGRCFIVISVIIFLSSERQLLRKESCYSTKELLLLKRDVTVQEISQCAKDFLLWKRALTLQEIWYYARDPLLFKRFFTVQESCWCWRAILLCRRAIVVQENFDSFVYLLNSSVSFH
jgi:hypothetical protein